jgi:cell division septation protein DedD
VSEPRTHYQISLTARQAVGVFLGLLLSLSLAFFFGLMAGLSGRGGQDPGETGVASAIAEKEAAPEPMPLIETAVPTAKVPAGPLGSRTELAGGSGAPTPPPAEPTAPATLHPFEDGSAGEASPVASASGGRSPAGEKSAGRPSENPSAKFWVQVASLSSRDEASALSNRLARRGFRAQVLTAAGPKGKGKVYRIRVGPYGSEDDASRAASKLSKQENVQSPWVVPDGR